ncbi:MAG: GTPase Era [Firmicutes bacterium]|nr:GTPase Era [Bacillota bacterium]
MTAKPPKNVPPKTPPPAFRSGFVSIIGRPNVGKSTLMNLFLGEKIAIVSNKPQTTRNRITGILTGDGFQIVFLDTPGLHAPASKLGRFMMKSADSAMVGADCLLFLTEPRGKMPDGDKIALEKLVKTGAPVFLVINKIDLVEKSSLLGIIAEYSRLYDFAEVIPISALKAENTGLLLEMIRCVLPEGPMYFPGDMVTDQPERQLAAELIREKALRFLQEEVPHGVAVEIMSMKKRPGGELVDVEATIYCEKDSHKGILIGRNGDMLKKIGSAARIDAERLLGSRIVLKLWVKVKKGWRDNDFLLRSFGYDAKSLE